MSKISELENDEKIRITDELDAVSEIMGNNPWEAPATTQTRHHKVKEAVGLCHDCEKLSYVVFEHGGVLAECTVFNRRFTGADRVVECSRHAKRGLMTLQAAMSLAHLIDVSDRKIGF